MQLYTYQSQEAYERLMLDGVLRITEENKHLTMACREDWRDMARGAYDYMADRMRYLIGPAPAGVVYPVWAWYKWEGRRTPVPEHDAHYKGMRCITFRVDRRRALLSDFDAFSFYVFNGACIPETEEESEMAERIAGDPACGMSGLYDYYRRATWERIFQIDRAQDSYSMTGGKNGSVQATLWELRREQIISVRDVS